MSTVPSLSINALRSRLGDWICPHSFAELEDGAVFVVRDGDRRMLGVLAEQSSGLLNCFRGWHEQFDVHHVLKLCPTGHENCLALRRSVPWLRPRALGLDTSFGFGDRLGMATPGHVRALFMALGKTPAKRISPVFAQQSVRENDRTGRSPQDVLDDATWGQLEGGWQGNVGADADHLKTSEDIDRCVRAGYSLFTVDPGDFVDVEAEKSERRAVREKLSLLPWVDLESSPEELVKRYCGMKIDLGHRRIVIDEQRLLVAAAKYGRAIAHVAKMARHLESKRAESELEISIDEIETPTTPLEHFYIAGELRRLRVQWISLALRYVGRFEKAIDYIGDLDCLSQSLTDHASIAAQMGPYKLGLHSGSDKFRIYPLFVEATEGLVHIKTAGTSYLEALRVIANFAPELFRELAALAIERYSEDRLSYHVSADLASFSAASMLGPKALPRLLDDGPARQVLHVTFGSVLNRYGNELKAALTVHLEDYYNALETHFVRHLAPLL